MRVPPKETIDSKILKQTIKKLTLHSVGHGIESPSAVSIKQKHRNILVVSHVEVEVQLCSIGCNFKDIYHFKSKEVD